MAKHKALTVGGKFLFTTDDIQVNDSLLINWRGQYIKVIFNGSHISAPADVFTTEHGDVLIIPHVTIQKRYAVGLPLVVGKYIGRRCWAVSLQLAV